ncbi:MAG TPA: FecR family protein [Polyangia bacterium]|nr:FecR family protein [Polyangia bacterium]
MSVGEEENINDSLSPSAAELTRLARKNLGHMSDAQHARGVEAVRGHGARRRGERRRRLLALGGTTSAMAVAAFLLAPPVMQRIHRHYDRMDEAPPLALQVESGAIDAAGAIVAQNDEQAALRFGDGTVIRLGTDTRGRLAEVDGHGAHVAIQNGSAHVSVVHKPHARWLIDAGPYQITVHGTVFSASWDESQQRLDVKMERGLVSVAGPVTNGPIAVRAGQALTVKLKRSQVMLRDLDRDEVVADVDADVDDIQAPDEAPGDEIAPPVVAPAPPARTKVALKASRAQKTRSWTASLSAGDFDTILDEAERDIGHVLATRGTEDLAALADAARYRRHDDVARRALMAQRRRFAGSPRAADAAFFLGRLDENGGRGHGPALAWYERYLDEAPRGSYVAEAMGRKMIAVEELHGAAAARNVAEQYIRRFPRGSYAGAAHALLGAR